jgi:hypothetical protein
MPPPASGTLWLEAPDYAALDTLACRPEPFVLWPVGPKPLLAHWMDEAVRRNVAEVVIIAPDRPHLVRAALAGGHYWSRAVRVLPQRGAEAPADCARLDGLPGQPSLPPVATPAALLARWLELQHAWLNSRHSGEISIDRHLPPGAWIGPLAQVHPKARLIAPCWVGARALIGAGVVLGPNALVGERSVVDDGAIVREAAVLAESYVGPRVNLHRMIAAGAVLLDAARGTRVDITDRFILASLRDRGVTPGPAERLLALLLWLAALPWSLAHLGAPSIGFTPLGWGGRQLRTGGRGPLLVRRRSWLWAVFAGRLRLIGVLPRTVADLARLPDDVRALVAQAPAGAISWADANGVHRTEDPLEWLHAVYQASGPDAASQREIRRRIWPLLAGRDDA